MHALAPVAHHRGRHRRRTRRRMDQGAADLGALPQYQGLDVEQFRGPKTVTILAPAHYTTGDITYRTLRRENNPMRGNPVRGHVFERLRRGASGAATEAHANHSCSRVEERSRDCPLLVLVTGSTAPRGPPRHGVSFSKPCLPRSIRLTLPGGSPSLTRLRSSSPVIGRSWAAICGASAGVCTARTARRYRTTKARWQSRYGKTGRSGASRSSPSGPTARASICCLTRRPCTTVRER